MAQTTNLKRNIKKISMKFMVLFKIVVWAIIFLAQLRFPPGISIATVLKYAYILQHIFSFIPKIGHI